MSRVVGAREASSLTGGIRRLVEDEIRSGSRQPFAELLCMQRKHEAVQVEVQQTHFVPGAVSR